MLMLFIFFMYGIFNYFSEVRLTYIFFLSDLGIKIMLNL